MSDYDERVERYLAGEMTPAERLAFEDDALANPQLSDRLYQDGNVSAALEKTARARRERLVAASSAVPWWRRRIVQWLAPALAVSAVTVFVIVQRTAPPEHAPVFRSVDDQMQAISPHGDVTLVPSQFVWRASSAAAFYRFELFDGASVRVFSTVTADTMVTLDSAATTWPAQGYWVVTPLNDLRVGIGNAIVTRYKTIE